MSDMEWRIFVCSDCEEEDPFRFAQPVPAGSHPERSPDFDFCPRCGGHLPWTERGIGKIEVVQHTKGYGDIPFPPGGAT